MVSPVQKFTLALTLSCAVYTIVFAADESTCEGNGCIYSIDSNGNFHNLETSRPTSGTDRLQNYVSTDKQNDVRDLYKSRGNPSERSHLAIASIFYTANRIAEGYRERLTEEDMAVLGSIDQGNPFRGYQDNRVNLFMDESCLRILQKEYGAIDIGDRLTMLRELERSALQDAFSLLSASLSPEGKEVLEEVYDRYQLGVGGAFTDWQAFAVGHPQVLLENVKSGCSKRGVSADD